MRVMVGLMGLWVAIGGGCRVTVRSNGMGRVHIGGKTSMVGLGHGVHHVVHHGHHIFLHHRHHIFFHHGVHQNGSWVHLALPGTFSNHVHQNTSIKMGHGFT